MAREGVGAGEDRASQSSAWTDEETDTSAQMSTERDGGDVVQRQEPPPIPEARQESTVVDEEDEEGECGFCLFMKGGPCREAFVEWEDCVEAAERSGENIVDSCLKATGLLRSCMEAHAEYYEPILRVEKAMAEEADGAMQRETAAATRTGEGISGQDKRSERERRH